MNKRKLFGTILGILFWSVCVVFFTFAYYEWRSTNTSIVIGINDLSTKCMPGTDVNVENIGPVLNYEDGVKQEFSIENGMNKEMAIDLRLDITSISDNLLVESFKYAVVTDTSGGTNYDYTNPVVEGNFENFVVGSNLITTALAITPSITQHFRLIVYIDGNMKNDINMQNNSLVANLMVGNCEENAISVDELVYQAIYSETDNSLTFIYNKPVSVGDTYNDKVVSAVYTGFETSRYSSYSVVPWCADGNSAKITSVTFEEVVAPVSTSSWFAHCSNLVNIDLKKLDTSNVTTMDHMFYKCSSLTSLDVSNFDTSNVTMMNSLFRECSKLLNLDLSNFDTSNVTAMDLMFAGSSSLTSLDLSNFDTSNVKYMGSMFYGCSSLTSLDLSNFNTSKVPDMSHMFRECSSLTSLDISSFDTSKVENMYGVFYGCSSLTSIDVSNFNTNKVTDMSHMFQECSSLTSLDISNFNTSSLIDIAYMFKKCTNLVNLNLGVFDTSKVTETQYMFYGCSKLVTSLTISNPSVTAYEEMFSNAATATGASIILYYVGDNPNTTSVDESTEAIVDAMKATGTGNIEKGCYGTNCPIE